MWARSLFSANSLCRVHLCPCEDEREEHCLWEGPGPLAEALNLVSSIRKRNQSLWINLTPLTSDCGFNFHLNLRTNLHGCALRGFQVIVFIQSKGNYRQQASQLQLQNCWEVELPLSDFLSFFFPLSFLQVCNEITSAKVQGLGILCLGLSLRKWSVRTWSPIVSACCDISPGSLHP